MITHHAGCMSLPHCTCARHERRLECRATARSRRRRYSVVPRRKKGYEHLPPRSRCRMSLSCFRVHKDMTGGARPHFGFSAFLTWSVLDVHRDTAPIYGKTIPNYD
ncbi:hypothetical protein TNIN_290561 [Trichonephila inaurata madagascariensis]|uniref:Uncharacterized protein n=1 Tax=Trichonephila inaurata madagascariensis TaxID=2747483 RepID=A0A8X6XIV7_9ARAC|nr:hypothetical protein TNIN_290561 [Trichonephila inaurata madagascariensis]